MDPREKTADRSSQYTDTSPAQLLHQLNENWKKLRLLELAVADRDRVIDQLHGSIAELHDSVGERDETIKLLHARLRYARVRVILLYSLVGGIAGEGVHVLVKNILAHWIGH